MKCLLSLVRWIKKINYNKFVSTHSNGKTIFDFGKFTRLEPFYYDIISGRISIKRAKNEQNKMDELITELKGYNPKIKNKRRSKFEILGNAKRFFNGRKMIIKAFENNIFSLSTKSLYKKQAEKEEEERKRKAELKKFTNYVINYETGSINKKLCKEHFSYKVPTELLRDLVNSDKEENIDLVTSLRDRLSELLSEVLTIDEEEVKKHKLDSTVDVFETILEFNEQRRERKGQGLKILTPQQMLSRLPISLAQLEA